MRKFYYFVVLILIVFSFQIVLAQDLKINHLENIPDTSVFSSSLPARVYFQNNSNSFSYPLPIYFNYSVNGIVQATALDSFIYNLPDSTEIYKDIILHTDSPIFRKGDNIVVVWPISKQVSHTANYYRKILFVTDSIHTSISNPNKNITSTEWNVLFNQDTKQLQILNQENLDQRIQLKIYDITGKLLLTEQLNKNSSSSLTNLTAAIYIFEIQTKNRKQTGRFLIY